ELRPVHAHPVSSQTTPRGARPRPAARATKACHAPAAGRTRDEGVPRAPLRPPRSDTRADPVRRERSGGDRPTSARALIDWSRPAHGCGSEGALARDVGDRLVEALLAGGGDAMFGVPGGQTLPLYAAARRPGMRHVVMRDERAAACAADAFARVSGGIGVCDATVGPGATNLVSGLAEAFASSIPLLAIVADVPTSWSHLRRRGVASQALEQAPLLAPVTKWVARVERADALDEMLDQALRVATTGRPGPVVLEIPDDVFQADPGTARRRFEPEAFASPRQRTAPARDALEAALRLIAATRRPLVLAGGGVHLSGAAEAVTRLAEATGIPVATTLNGKGTLDERHPLAAGVVGIFGDVRAGRALARADLVVVLGSKLD